MVLMRSLRWVSFGAATSLSLVLVVVLATATRNGDRSQVTITAGEANPADAPVSSSPDPPASSELYPNDTVVPPGTRGKDSVVQCLPGEMISDGTFTMGFGADSLEVAAVKTLENTPEQAVEERLAGGPQPLGGYAGASIVWERLDPRPFSARGENTIYLLGSLRGRTFVFAEVVLVGQLNRYIATSVLRCIESAGPDQNAQMPLPRDQWKLPSDVLEASNEEDK